jgi:hypothetical protein
LNSLTLGVGGGEGGSGLTSPPLLNTRGKTMAKITPITTIAMTSPQINFFFLLGVLSVGDVTIAASPSVLGISLSFSIDSDLSYVFVFLALFIEDFQYLILYPDY